MALGLALPVLYCFARVVWKMAWLFAIGEATGGWQSFGVLPLWLFLGGCAAASTIALFLVRIFWPISRSIVQAYVVFLASLTCCAPWVASGLSSVREDEARATVEEWGRRGDEAHKAICQEHIALLRPRFESPQLVKAAVGRWLILEDGLGIELHYVSDYPAFEAYARANLIGKHVDVRVPDALWASYSRGKSSMTEPFGGPTDAQGRRYGDVPALVYLDGVLVNERFATEVGARALAEWR